MTRELQVIDGLRIGGAETVLLGLLELTDHDRFPTYVASVGPTDEAFVERVAAASRGVFVVTGRALWDPRPVARLISIIRHERIDVVQTHLAGADFQGGLAARLGQDTLGIALGLLDEPLAVLPRPHHVVEGLLDLLGRVDDEQPGLGGEQAGPVQVQQLLELLLDTVLDLDALFTFTAIRSSHSMSYGLGSRSPNCQARCSRLMLCPL